MSWRIAALAIVLALPGCGATRRAPLLGVGPYVTRDGLVLDRVLTAAQEAGYLPREIDEAHGRFEVIARSDLRGRARFLVQCTADGWIVVLPEGPAIEREPDHVTIPGHLLAEYQALVLALESGVAVRPR
ncbi:MAG: hypothetical protein M3Y87_23925 [Myxococcota bacterium]|nr:hypothetical protein [Myxococcota bacterium]